MGDTSAPGAMTRYHLYLKGKLAVQNYLHNEGERSLLYVGKVGINDLKLIKKVKDLHDPKYIPIKQKQ